MASKIFSKEEIDAGCVPFCSQNGEANTVTLGGARHLLLEIQ